MDKYLTPANIMLVIGLVGLLFGFYKAFYDPQKKSETNDLLQEQKMQSLREIYDTKLADVRDNIATLAIQSQNHIHAIDVKLEGIMAGLVSVNKDIVRLETIINERIPRKS